MKRITKVLIFIMLATFSLQTQAQVKFGLNAGMNVNDVTRLATKMRLAYHFGAAIDYGLSDVFSLQSGLLFTIKGFSIDLYDGYDGYQRVNYNYLEFPLNIAYKINDFQIYTGPYLAIGIGGKNKWDYTYKKDGDVYSESGENYFKPVFGEVDVRDLDENEDAYAALDYGFNLGFGYQTGSILIKSGYSLGLGNLSPAYTDVIIDRNDYKFSNRVIYLSASYFFGE